MDFCHRHLKWFVSMKNRCYQRIVRVKSKTKINTVERNYFAAKNYNKPKIQRVLHRWKKLKFVLCSVHFMLQRALIVVNR